MKKITVYYDASCATCRKDRARFETLAGSNVVAWFDITGQESALQERGIAFDEAQLMLHIELPNGAIIKDVESYIILLNQVWFLKPVSWFMSIPWIKEKLRQKYRAMVTKRLQRDGRYPSCKSC